MTVIVARVSVVLLMLMIVVMVVMMVMVATVVMAMVMIVRMPVVAMIMVMTGMIVFMAESVRAIQCLGHKRHRAKDDNHDDRYSSPKDIFVKCLLKNVLQQIAIPEHNRDAGEQAADGECEYLVEVVRRTIFGV
jgi:hypothetical protein